MRLLIGAVAAACVAGLLGPGALAAQQPVTVDGFGLWPLQRLGVTGPIELDTSLPNPAASVDFRFTPSARQGPSGWYLGHLHATVEVGPQPPGAASFLDASVNHWEWAQIMVKTVRVRGRVYTVWRSASVLGGAERREPGFTAHISFENFLTIPSVKPGPATLTFAIERYKGAVMKKVVIGADTALEYSRLGPGHLVLAAQAPARAPRGQLFAVDVRVTNTGARPVRRIRLSWDFPPTVVRPVSRTARFDAYLAPHQTATVRFWFRPLRAGVARLDLLALGRGGGGTASCVVRIG